MTRAAAGPANCDGSIRMTSTTLPNSPKPDHNQSDEIDIGQLVGMLVDKWVLIALNTVLAAFMGIFYAFSVTPVFQADALVQVEEEKQGLDVAAMLGGDLATGGSSTNASLSFACKWVKSPRAAMSC